MPSACSSPVLVLGVGNILLGDEGVGVHVIRQLERHTLPLDVELLDGGTASLDLLDSIANRDKVVVIDAVKGGSEPGAIYRFTYSDIKAQRYIFTSLHQVGLLETLSIATYLNCMPREIIFFGIEPKQIDWGLELSPEAAATVPRVIELVLAEIENKRPKKTAQSPKNRRKAASLKC